MGTSGIVGDRFILTLPGYGPESCRSLSACLSAFSCFCHLTPSVFFPLFLLLSLWCCTSITLYPLPLFCSGFLSPASHCVLSIFFFCLSTSCFLSSTCCVVKLLRDSCPAVSEMIVFAGGELRVYLQWKMRHMLGLQGTCISKEPLSFELVTDMSSVFKSWGCFQVKRTLCGLWF